MQCPKCGAIVLKGDVTCKKCGAPLLEASENFHAEDVCRSRAMLFFRAFVGAPNGAHLKWLGYDEEAAEVAAKYGILEQVKSSVTGIFSDGGMIHFVIFLLALSCYQCYTCIGILFGMYRTDAQGHPVRWITKKKH